jgi:hypothetical protein
MAQKILLKRSGVSGSIPTTASVDLGELALNTHDGKAFLKKSGSGFESVQEFLVTDSTASGDITLVGSITANTFVGGDFSGSFSGSFRGSGAGLTGVTASMRPDDFDFNSEPFAGTVGYIQATGSLYKVATTEGSVDFRYNDVTIATITTGSGFSGSLYGIGDVLAFSGSVAGRLINLEISASLGPDAGEL